MAWRKGDNTGPKAVVTSGGKTVHRGNYMAKLNWQIVREMREAFAQGATQGSLCRKYGVSINTVARIVRGEAWIDKEAKPILRWTDPPTPEMTADEIAASAERMLKLQQSVKQEQILPKLTLEEIMRREAEKEESTGALEKLNETAKEMDGGLGEFLKKD